MPGTILHVTRNHAANGGAPILIRTLINGIRSYRHEVCGIFPAWLIEERTDRDGPKEGELDYTVTCPLPLINDLPRIRDFSYTAAGVVAWLLRTSFEARLLNKLRRLEFDLMHLHYVGNTGSFLRVANRLNKKVLLSIYALHPEGDRQKEFAELDLYCRKNPSKIVVNVVSEAQRAQLRDRLPNVDLRVIYNGVQTEDFAVRPKRERSARSEIVFCAVGRLNPEKGHATLIDAFAKLATLGRPIRLVIAGEGPLRPKLEKQIERLGLGEMVELAGFRDDVAGFLADADVFVLPSHSEALALALIEAMSAGLPTVATAIGGVTEALEGGYGVLVKPEDPDELCKGMRLMLDEQVRKIYGERALKRAADFGIDRMLESYEWIYDELTSRR